MSDLNIGAGVSLGGVMLGANPVGAGAVVAVTTPPLPTSVVAAVTTPIAGVGLGVDLSGAGAAPGATGVTTIGAGIVVSPLAGVGVGVTTGSPTGTPGVGVGVGVTVGAPGGPTGIGVGIGGGGSTGTGVGTTPGAGPGTGVGTTPGGGTGTDPGAGGGGTGGGPGGGLGATSGGLPDTHTAFINIFRLSGAADISSADNARLAVLDQQVSSGAITPTQAILQIGDWAAGSTAVAETSYQFFTGLTPSADGLSYLVHSPNNTTDLSDAYYSQFDLENRYINFASNLGLHSDAAPAFARDFGSLSFRDAVATAYDRIIGDTNAQAAGIDYQAAVSDIVSRQPYFQAVAQERFGTDNQDLSTKLAAVAYIMEESVRADVGRYGQANQNFLFDLADGKAQFHIDLVGVYGHGAPANLTF